mmetsp:Transcript_97814/g.261012  ORF Transcript_97814/g.261012 Transcript_97814/m.261012 type:complete len:500 (+) Transcript_97814:68-1567(+)
MSRATPKRGRVGESPARGRVGSDASSHAQKDEDAHSKSLGLPSTPRRCMAALEGTTNSVPSRQLLLGSEIGKGRFKRVLRGKYKTTDVVVLRYASDTTNVSELNVLATLARQGQTRFVPHLLGVCHDKDHLLVLQEIAEHGTLKDAVNSATNPLSVSHIVVACLGLAQALGFLKTLRLIHGDLSCRNVLVITVRETANDTHIKVTDFGLSIMLPPDTDTMVLKQPRAVRWSAPEIIQHHSYSFASDVWALGTTMWEALAKDEVPWAARKERADVQRQLRILAGDETGEPADMAAEFWRPEGCPSNVYEVVLACFAAVPTDRPTFEEVAEGLELTIRPQSESRTPSTTCPASRDLAPEADLSKALDFPMLTAFLASAGCSALLSPGHVGLIRNELEAARQRCADVDCEASCDPHNSLHTDVENGSWTLWTYFQGVLGQQCFSSKDNALQGFNDWKWGPSVLRDADGNEIAANQWQTRYFALPQMASMRGSIGVGRRIALQ